MLIPTLCFTAALFGARLALATRHTPRAAAALIAALPLLPFAWFVVWSARAIERLDELHRLITRRSLAFAFPATGALLLVLLLVDRAITLRPDEVGFRHLPLAMAGLYVAGLWLARRSYE